MGRVSKGSSGRTPDFGAMAEVWQILAAIGVVLAVIVAWKFLKFIFRIAVIVVAIAILYLLAKNAGWVG